MDFVGEENLNVQAAERKSILKTNLEAVLKKRFPPSPRPTRSVLKKNEDFIRKRSPSPRSNIKNEQDHAYDEGISSDDSNSDEMVEGEVRSDQKFGNGDGYGKFNLSSCLSGKNGSDETTDESSGGREIQNIIGCEKSPEKKEKQR